MEGNNTPQSEGKRIRVQPVGSQGHKFDAEELIAQVCYFYPQYKFEEAERLSMRRINILLKVVRKQQALQMYNLTQIAAAPHTKKGEGVKKLSEHFKKIANS